MVHKAPFATPMPKPRNCSGFVRSTTFWAWLAGQVSFLQFFNPEQFRGFGIGVANGALWTITVELQFYVFIPLLYATVFGRWKGT